MHGQPAPSSGDNNQPRERAPSKPNQAATSTQPSCWLNRTGLHETRNARASGLLVVLAAQAGGRVGDLDVQLARALHDGLALEGRHVVGDLSGEGPEVDGRGAQASASASEHMGMGVHEDGRSMDEH